MDAISAIKATGDLAENAPKDDRTIAIWMALILIVLVVTAVFILAKFVGTIIKRQAEHLEKIQERQTSQTESLIAVVTECKSVIERNNELIENNSHRDSELMARAEERERQMADLIRSHTEFWKQSSFESGRRPARAGV